jgi:hypothetical protein
MWHYPTENSDGIDDWVNKARSERFDDQHFLGISDIRRAVCAAMADVTETEVSEADFIPSFIRVSPLNASPTSLTHN